MAEPIPKWLFLRYVKIWAEKKNDRFDYDEVRRLLNEKDDRTLSVILSDLRKSGWLEIALDPNNARKRTYKLKHIQDIIEEIAGSLKA